MGTHAVLAGASVGAMILPHFVVAVMDAYGWRIGLRIQDLACCERIVRGTCLLKLVRSIHTRMLSNTMWIYARIVKWHWHGDPISVNGRAW